MISLRPGPDDISRRRLRRSTLLVSPPLLDAPDEERALYVFREEGRQRPHPIGAIGLELRVAFLAIARSPTAGDCSWRRKCRELLRRPAVEPPLLAKWNHLKRFEMTAAEMGHFCQLLWGLKQEPRVSHSYGLWEGGDVRFEAPDEAQTWWSDIQSVAKDPSLQSLLPAYAFARTIFAHPYPDGNGRLARGLVHGALARTGAYDAPLLPLAPAFYMNAAKLAAALRQLSKDANWNSFATVFKGVLEDAAALRKRLPLAEALK